jgi:hypothetical protein
VTASKRFGLVALVGLLAAASAAQAEPHKKGTRGAKSRGKDSSIQRVDSPGASSSRSDASMYTSPFDPPPAQASLPTSAPPPPAPQTATPPERDEAASETAPPSPRPDFLPMLVVGIQPLWEGRVLRQNDATGWTFRKYGAIGFPSVELAGEVYPLANGPSKFLRGFGLTGQYARAFGFQSDSTFVGDTTYPQSPVDTSFSRYSGGLRYRLPVNPESEKPFVLGFSASYSGWSYNFAEAQQAVETPTASYRMAKVGVDGSLQIRPVTFYGYVSYLHAFSITAPATREIDTLRAPHLPNAVGAGFDLRGAVGVRVLRWLEIRASVQYGLLAYELKSLDGDDYPSVRALDSYLSAGLGPYVSF